METFLAILLALGIYVVVPVLIGLMVIGGVTMYDRRFQRQERTRAVEEAEQMVKRPAKATTTKPAKEKVLIG